MTVTNPINYTLDLKIAKSVENNSTAHNVVVKAYNGSLNNIFAEN